ncbi:hypothetical protein BC332_23283 [Capsicum chinense]|nr:hypothetical protein BC332_23283 [Capsicum chinense]
MDVNAVVLYLAFVIAGYVVVSIADSFAPAEIATRLMISKARAIFTQLIWCGYTIVGEENTPILDCDNNFIPPLAELVSFAALQPVSGMGYHDN